MIPTSLLNANLEDIKLGYKFDAKTKIYYCLFCETAFEEGEIFPINQRLYTADKAVKLHIMAEHGSCFDNLLKLDKKYTGLTENQKHLINSFHKGVSDKDIAKESGTSPATIRYQRFALREKAKQAKLFLATIELMEEELSKQDWKNDTQLPVHSGATMVDERHIATLEDRDNAYKAYFSSLSPLVLKEFPAKEKKKIIVLKRILEEFSVDKIYIEKDINQILKNIFPDYATVRRYLIEYGFMERTLDCKEYWIKK